MMDFRLQVDEEKPPSAQHTQGTSSQFFQPVSGGNSRLDGDSHSSHSGLMAPPGSYYYYPQGSQVLLRPPSPPPASPNGPPVRVPKIPHPTSIPVSQGPVKRRKKVAAQQRLVVPSSGRASGILAGQSGRPRVRVIKAQPGMLDLLGNEESQAGQQFWTADKPTIRESHGVEPPRRRLHVDKDKTPQIMSEKISSLVQPHSQPESVNEEEKASSGDGSRGHSGIRLSTVNIEAGRPTIPVSKQHPDRLLGNATSMGRKSNQRSELDFSAIHCPGCREAIANELRTEQRLRQRQSQAGDMTRIGAFTVKENDKVRTCRRKATVERLEKESWDEIDLGRMEEKRMEKRTKDASFTPATMEESRVKQTGYEQQSLPSGIEVEPLHCKRKSKRKQETQRLAF
ncbi:unnamed protein product [Protopolystoma xenopodis]|uniref:Uncharacterized protein n=1 Tax=Protopolystoma xenopodis TaxID=117903 RepID=A0A448WCM3_9PLAT|nr:unnamed protein product [Protopolystoma xenopodis]